mmetsp:Transcript_11703/g.23825  ORF Transcript_11703/g.23825 Transcript_11703/m.23825 type:complete len:303 (-) Transcript_11703:847-1755(-)
MFLLNKHIPQYILDLPSEAMNSPLGPLIRPMIDGMQAQIQQASVGHEAFDIPTPQPAVLSSIAPPPALFDKGNVAVIARKLKAFDPKFDLEQREDVEYLWTSLTRLDQDHAFPALDLMRLRALECEDTCGPLVHKVDEILTNYVEAEAVSRPSLMMSLRLFANLFCHMSSLLLLMSKGEDLILRLCEAALLGVEHAHVSVREAGAALALNLSDPRCKLPEDAAIRLLYGLEGALQVVNLNEAITVFQVLSAFGLILSRDSELHNIAKALEPNLSRFLSRDNPDDVQKCAEEISAVLRKDSLA